MLAIRKLNNNAVICRDSRGREVVALGKGVGFGADFPRELSMADIERTFYSVDAQGQRINAAARLNDISYSQFMHGLKLAGIELDRKMLAQMAYEDIESFNELATIAKKALEA